MEHTRQFVASPPFRRASCPTAQASGLCYPRFNCMDSAKTCCCVHARREASGDAPASKRAPHPRVYSSPPCRLPCSIQQQPSEIPAPNRSSALRRTGGVDAQGYRNPEPGFVSIFFQAPQIHVRRWGKADKEFCGAEIWSALANLRLTLRGCGWVRFEVGVVDATGHRTPEKHPLPSGVCNASR